jgi:hypothetical protein
MDVATTPEWRWVDVLQLTKFEPVINLETARPSASTCHRRCSRAPTR